MIMMLWVVTEKMRLWIQADKMVFLCRVPELSCRDKGEELRVELLLFCIKRRQLRLFGQLIRIPLSAFLWRFSRHDKLGGDPEADPEPASHLAWECLGKMIAGGEQPLDYLVRTAATVTRALMSRRK